MDDVCALQANPGRLTDRVHYARDPFISNRIHFSWAFVVHSSRAASARCARGIAKIGCDLELFFVYFLEMCVCNFVIFVKFGRCAIWRDPVFKFEQFRCG